MKRRNAAGKILNATSKPFPSAKKTVALVQLHREKLKNSDVVSEPILYRINRAKRSTPASFLCPVLEKSSALGAAGFFKHVQGGKPSP